MAEVAVSLARSRSVGTSAAEAHAFFADVARWSALFPRAERVERVPGADGEVWRWTMEAMGPPGYAVQTVYACRYHTDAAALTVDWEPVAGEGNAAFAGGVQLRPDGDEAVVDLRLDAVLDLPVPRFAMAVVKPAVALEFGRMTDRFIARVARELEAGGPSSRT